MQVRNIAIKKKTAQGIEISLPNAALVMAIGRKGFVMCGYLNMETAGKLGDCAALVRGVKSIDELLAARVAEVSPAARKLGVRAGMTGASALAKML